MEHRPLARVGLIALILVLLSILVALVANLAPLVGRTRAGRTSVPIVANAITSDVSLADAGARARDRAASWAGDAELIRITSVWLPTPGWEDLQQPPLAWVFTFYSPSARAVASAAIDDDVVLWVPPREIPTRPRSLSVFPPDQGPSVAWLTFRASGGDRYLAQGSETQVSFRVEQREATPVWVVTAHMTGSQMETVVDAQTGVLLSTTQRPRVPAAAE